MPAGVVLFLHDGPFAWNGLIGIYVPLTAFCVWIGATTWAVHQALTQQIIEGSQPG
jgi:hypothetical protein